MNESIHDYLGKLLNSYGCKSIYFNERKSEIVCQCPFHFPKRNHKTFGISTIPTDWKGRSGYFFKCFSCGEKGSVIKLVAHIFNCSYNSAKKKLAKEIKFDKITLEMLAEEVKKLHESKEEQSKKEIVLPTMSENQQPMINYMKNRSKKYHGLLKTNYIIEKYGLYYCNSGRYSGRIIMPIKNEDGKIIGFNDRAINEELRNKSLHQYGENINSMLYGYYENVQGQDNCIISEGAFDVYQIDCALRRKRGMSECYAPLALMGLGFSSERLYMLLKRFKCVIFMLDNDEAGLKATKQITQTIHEDIRVKIATDKYARLKDPGKCTEEEIINSIIKSEDFKYKKSFLDYMMEKYNIKE